ncbi:hypothetical protein DXX93_10325 [Thalassotalea euphylliae]|uniref:Immunity MXAN-0049 protein domain-containing protein n=1 Tax=Thalassotalea euphylliae TaxID=1655234 RepID=A0A3E0TSM1_9GAMM|nr:DUF1629 domain-containing protein [Thalassotalea euphylliae]REL26925.1 hypothetical protein DXX93_10325 [Thalassotalea euphylliae]
MKNYNDEYYIVRNESREDALYIKALERSADRDFEFERLTLGQEPLFFENSYKEGIKHVLPSILFDAPTPIVNNQIRDRLKYFNFVDMQLYPAVYIDDEGHYHENYWCMNFGGRLDCLDREKSIFYKSSQEDLLEDPLADDLSVKQYSLSEQILDEIPEQDRLIFKMGGDDMGYVFIHQKIADIFKAENATGIELFKVADFEDGMQYR